MQTLIELCFEMEGGGLGKAPNNEENLYTPHETMVGGVEHCLSDIDEIMDLGEVTDAGS